MSSRPLGKAQRQHRIGKLLEEQTITNQAQLVELLGADGVRVNQATVSRDLEEMGAIKVRVPGGETAYAIPELPSQQFAPEDTLRRVLGEWVVEVERSGDLVVLRTPPGSADRAATRSAISRRSGSPVTTPPLSGVPSNVTPTRAAHRAPARLASPGRAFCSCTTTGTPRRCAATYAGVDT